MAEPREIDSVRVCNVWLQLAALVLARAVKKVQPSPPDDVLVVRHGATLENTTLCQGLLYELQCATATDNHETRFRLASAQFSGDWKRFENAESGEGNHLLEAVVVNHVDLEKILISQGHSMALALIRSKNEPQYRCIKVNGDFTVLALANSAICGLCQMWPTSSSESPRPIDFSSILRDVNELVSRSSPSLEIEQDDVVALQSRQLRTIQLLSFDNGVVVQIPGVMSREKALAAFPRVHDAFLRVRNWGSQLMENCVGNLNARVANTSAEEFITMEEGFFNIELIRCANHVLENRPSTRLVLISGPSASGKTTFSNRFRCCFESLGVNTGVVSLDDYYRDVTESGYPKLPDGKPNHETIGSIRVADFQNHVMRLFAGEAVETPVFDMVNSRPFPSKSRRVCLRGIDEASSDFSFKKGILIVEGLFTLDPVLTETIDDSVIFRLFVVPLPQYNLDELNFISNQDVRLIRRISRDFLHRGRNASVSISRVPAVTNGEQQSVLPALRFADYVFNTTMSHELPVLWARSRLLLQQVEIGDKNYIEAARYRALLDHCLPVSDTAVVPAHSLLREFTGGSVFEEEEETQPMDKCIVPIEDGSLGLSTSDCGFQIGLAISGVRLTVRATATGPAVRLPPIMENVISETCIAAIRAAHQKVYPTAEMTVEHLLRNDRGIWRYVTFGIGTDQVRVQDVITAFEALVALNCEVVTTVNIQHDDGVDDISIDGVRFQQRRSFPTASSLAICQRYSRLFVPGAGFLSSSKCAILWIGPPNQPLLEEEQLLVMSSLREAALRERVALSTSIRKPMNQSSINELLLHGQALPGVKRVLQTQRTAALLKVAQRLKMPSYRQVRPIVLVSGPRLGGKTALIAELSDVITAMGHKVVHVALTSGETTPAVGGRASPPSICMMMLQCLIEQGAWQLQQRRQESRMRAASASLDDATDDAVEQLQPHDAARDALEGEHMQSLSGTNRQALTKWLRHTWNGGVVAVEIPTTMTSVDAESLTILLRKVASGSWLRDAVFHIRATPMPIISRDNWHSLAYDDVEFCRWTVQNGDVASTALLWKMRDAATVLNPTVAVEQLSRIVNLLSSSPFFSSGTSGNNLGRDSVPMFASFELLTSVDEFVNSSNLFEFAETKCHAERFLHHVSSAVRFYLSQIVDKRTAALEAIANEVIKHGLAILSYCEAMQLTLQHIA